MPIYEYVCTGCGAEFEVIQRFSDPPLEKCDSCSGSLEKKISTSAFHLKGSGWYLTDYARKSSSESSTGDNGKPKSEEKGDTTSTDKGAAAKPSETSTSKSDAGSKET